MELFFPEIANGEDKSSQLGNRIKNNYRHIRKWAKRTQTNCFRIYDKEISNYPLAIDYYDGRFCVQDFSRKGIDDELTPELIDETNQVLCAIFNTNPDFIFWRSRMKQKETRQYEKIGDAKEFFTV